MSVPMNSRKGIVTLMTSSKPVISYEDETYLIPPPPFPAD